MKNLSSTFKKAEKQISKIKTPIYFKLAKYVKVNFWDEILTSLDEIWFVKNHKVLRIKKGVGAIQNSLRQKALKGFKKNFRDGLYEIIDDKR